MHAGATEVRLSTALMRVVFNVTGLDAASARSLRSDARAPRLSPAADMLSPIWPEASFSCSVPDAIWPLASDMAESAAHKMDEAAQKAGDMAERAAQKTGDMAEKAAQKAGDMAEKAAQKVSEAAGKAADKFSDVAENLKKDSDDTEE